MTNPLIDDEEVRRLAEELKSNATKSETTLHQAVNEVLRDLRSGERKLVSLGIPDLDYAIGGGVQCGEMVVVGARPGHGKSAICLQMVHHLTQKGIPVLIVSQEMSRVALGKRVLQFISEVPQDDWEYRVDDLASDAEMHFKGIADAYLLESTDNALSMCERALWYQKNKGVKVVFVDYVQILQGIGKSQYERVTDGSSRIRKLATESGLIFIVLAQLNREVEKRPTFEPTGKDIKDSGQIEQDADVILFSIWPYKLDQEKPKNNYQFIVDKNRNRPIKKYGFDVFFEPERQRFLDAIRVSEWTGE